MVSRVLGCRTSPFGPAAAHLRFVTASFSGATVPQSAATLAIRSAVVVHQAVAHKLALADNLSNRHKTLNSSTSATWLVGRKSYCRDQTADYAVIIHTHGRDKRMALLPN